jgi:hypothetical protein
MRNPQKWRIVAFWPTTLQSKKRNGFSVFQIDSSVTFSFLDANTIFCTYFYGFLGLTVRPFDGPDEWGVWGQLSRDFSGLQYVGYN